MVNIPLFKVFMSPTAAPEVAKVLNSGFIGQGAKVDEFERELKTFLKNDLVVTVNSGTSAEQLALLLLQKPSDHLRMASGDGNAGYTQHWPGMQPGDEVLSSPMTCTATNWPIHLAGYKIKWVDVDSTTLNMDLDDLARKITPTTKAIMLVLWGGMPVDFNKLAKIQDNAQAMYGFRPAVIIDGAHSMGSTFDGKPINNLGHMTTYSLQAIKHITSVDGGLLVLPHAELYKRAKLLRWYGIDRENNKLAFRCDGDIPEIGTKWHMNDVNATVGLENLKHGKDIISKHKDNAKYYNDTLKNTDGVTLLTPTPNSDSAYWIYTMKVERRDQFIEMMSSKGITVSRVHERNDKHSSTRQYVAQLPTLDKVVKEMICIPVGWWVTSEERAQVTKAIKAGW